MANTPSCQVSSMSRSVGKQMTTCSSQVHERPRSKIDVHSLFRCLCPMSRSRRMRRFERLLKPTEGTRIVDIGGTPYNWQFSERHPRILLVNISSDAASFEGVAGFEFMKGDGRHLDLEDNSFDIAFSNSVIEHLGSYESQEQFAAETSRVGCQLWVQTPARGFFLEPHFITPFVHWLPKRVRPWFVHWFSPWSFLQRPTKERTAEVVDEIRLLSYREMRALFPGCRILTERFLGWPRSYIAVRTASDVSKCQAP